MHLGTEEGDVGSNSAFSIIWSNLSAWINGILEKNMVVSEIATTCAHYGTEEFANGKFEKFKKPSVIIHWF